MTGTAIETFGVRSYGIFAQSVGGGGGNGGAVSSAATAASASGAGDNSAAGGSSSNAASAATGAAVAAGLGGSGGAGGAGGAVTVSVSTPITTSGDQATAVFAQSVGGGGGTGGASIGSANSGAVAVDLALGGSGGKGGVGGAVSVVVHSPAMLSTSGDLAYGIFAQSVGGGGGQAGASNSTAADGGNASIGMALGGTAGSGQNGGAVSVWQNSTITTKGFGSDAIFAQSVGGGGGAGGSSTSSSSSGTVSVSLGLGGSGGAGGNGGAVTVQFGNQLDTSGDSAAAVFAQSVGGGGGAGASATSTSSMSGDGASAPLGLSLGGAGSGGGSGGTVLVEGLNMSGSGVTVTSDGITRQYDAAILTNGANAPGIFAQSIGGGGGTGGLSTSTAQSGGADAVSLALGGAAGSGSNGGSVSVCGTNCGALSGDAIVTAGANSDGILAQSIGGGGGNASSATSSGQTGGSDAGTSFAASLGGTAGGGGSGGSVLVNSAVQIQTLGDLSSAVVAQSIGGGGGNAGSAESAATANENEHSVAAAVALGGSGGSGGSGGAVTVTLSGTSGQIITSGTGATAVIAQSVGGGGGIAGFASGSSDGSGLSSSTVSGALGGTGGSGGAGGAVSLSDTQAVSTYGEHAIGLLAQSIGGGGGLSTASSFSDGWFSGSMVLGATGGSGGAGGSVALSALGNVTTHGALSSAMVAQSLGGGGGTSLVRAQNAQLGGTSTSAAGAIWVNLQAGLATAGNESLGLLAQSIGGGGGLASAISSATLGGAKSGSNGANVLLCGQHTTTGECGSVLTTGSITTLGAASAGLVEQSIGGGGGIALSGSHVISAVLGNGTGNGATVASGQNLEISTLGAGSVAALVQSIGGGGGAVLSAASGTAENAFDATLGGSSGTTGNAGQAYTQLGDSGRLSTSGVNAPGFVLQSIGGGGGYVSEANLAGTPSMSSSFTLGGHSESGSSNTVQFALGTVGVPVISTLGANSPGMVAQSIGGGGGVFAFANQSSGAVSGTVSGQLGQTGGSGGAAQLLGLGMAQVTTQGDRSPGIVLQNITGGGGLVMGGSADDDVLSGTIRLGATGGSASSFTALDTTELATGGGSITTTGAMSPAFVEQSIAGGGGMSLVRATTVVLGGSLGSATTGAGLTLANDATISVSGAGSVGLLAQSIGGGGGFAYASNSATLGGAPSGANGGAVVVESNGAITASGARSIGVLAQSIGGGGGAVISTGEALTSTFNKGVGNAASVAVTITKPITMTGVDSFAVVAQSARGGGGLVLDSSGLHMQGGTSGSSGAVKVSVASGVSVVASGQGSVAIKTFSSTDPVVSIGSGATVIGGSGGSAVEFDGPTNELDNAGSVGTVDGASGMAVRALSGDTTLLNSGLLQGNVSLDAAGANLLHNLAGGTILAGSTLNLGTAGLLQNDGVLENAGTVGQSTAITGNLQQSSSGTLALRLYRAQGLADSFTVTGTAQIAGRLQTVLEDAGKTTQGTVSLGTVLSAQGGLDVSDLAVGDNTAILTYRLQADGNTASLASSADFSPQGLNGRNAAVGGLIARAQSSGSTRFNDLVAKLVELPTVQALGQAYWNASGAVSSAIATSGVRLNAAFARTLLRHSNENGTNDVWAQGYGDSAVLGLGAQQGNADLNSYSSGFAFGYDHAITQTASAGIAVAHAASRTDMGGSFHGRDDVTQLGIYGTQNFGAAYVALGAAYSWHDARTTRSLDLLGSSYNARFQAESITTRMEAGYHFHLGATRITPYAMLQYQDFMTPAYGESANGGDHPQLALNYRSRSVDDFSTGLGFAVARQVSVLGHALDLRSSAAWIHEMADSPSVSASFSGAADYAVQGSAIAPVANEAQLSASIEHHFSPNLVVGAQVYGDFAPGSSTTTWQGVLRYQW